MTSAWLHATALVVGEAGVLIEGPAGSGKSSLALALLDAAAARGIFGRLVGDDRVAVEARHGRVVVRPHPAIEGMIEQRGLGLLQVPHLPACVLALVVRCLPEGAPVPPRLPDAPPTTVVAGVSLPLLVLPAGLSQADRSRLVRTVLGQVAGATLQSLQSAC